MGSFEQIWQGAAIGQDILQNVMSLGKRRKAPLQEKLCLFNKYFEIILKNRCSEPMIRSL